LSKTHYTKIAKTFLVKTAKQIPLHPYLPLNTSAQTYNKEAIMAESSTNHVDLIREFTTLFVRLTNDAFITLDETEVREISWDKSLLFTVVTTRPIGFQMLKESIHKSWFGLGLKEITSFSDGLFMALFHSMGDRKSCNNRVLAFQTRPDCS
jgi:hypothetical protein